MYASNTHHEGVKDRRRDAKQIALDILIWEGTTSEGFLFLFVFYYVEAIDLIIGWLMTLEAEGDWLKFQFVSFVCFTYIPM